jgi:hypothetical protein
MNLIDNKYDWDPKNYAKIDRNTHSITVSVDTVGVDKNGPDRIFNRAVLNIRPDVSSIRPLLISLDYKSESSWGLGKFGIEVLNRDGTSILSAVLKNINGTRINEAYVLPEDIIANMDVEIRVYLITEGPGKQSITFQKLRLTYA